MRVQVFQDVPFEGLGSIRAWLEARAIPHDTTRFLAGDSPPPDAAYDSLIAMGGPMDAVLMAHLLRASS